MYKGDPQNRAPAEISCSPKTPKMQKLPGHGGMKGLPHSPSQEAGALLRDPQGPTVPGKTQPQSAQSEQGGTTVPNSQDLPTT